MLEIDKLQEILTITSEVVKNIPEPYRLDAFKIILSKLLSDTTGSVKKNGSTMDGNTDGDVGNSADPLDELISLCKISKDELKNVTSINDDNLEVVCRIDGNESHQQVVGSLIILFVHEIVFKQEWVKSAIVLESIKKIGVQDRGGNFSSNLKKHPELFLKRGTLQEYRLTTNNGRTIASKVINLLSKGKQVTKHDLKVTG